MLRGLCAVLLAEYLNSSFSRQMIPDVNEAMIQGYYLDLAYQLSDLEQLSEIQLMFKSMAREHYAAFQYMPDEPEYHLKPGVSLPLYPWPNLANSFVTFTFQRRSGNCSAVDLVGKYPWLWVSTTDLPRGSLNLDIVNQDTITLSIYKDGIFNQYGPLVSYYLSVPETCVLYLTHVERCAYYYRDPKQLYYSRQNNRSPELIGLESKIIRNFDQTSVFITSMEDIPTMKLHSIDRSTAEFVFQAATTRAYVFPENSILELDDSTTAFPIDRVKMVLQSPNAACAGFKHTTDAVQVSIDGMNIKLEYHKYQLNEILTLETLPDCQLRLIYLSRTVGDVSRQKIKTYATLALNSDTIKSWAFGFRGCGI